MSPPDTPPNPKAPKAPEAPAMPAAMDGARELLAGLPPILEIKRTLAGGEKHFECARLHLDGPHVVLLFVATAPMQVHGVALPAGTVTFGHFWRDRAYNVYHWL